MSKFDWTKLDNGWERHPLASCIIKQLSRVKAVMVYDDGSITTDSAIEHKETLRLLTEAIEQLKQCKVPAFAVGDRVRGRCTGYVYLVMRPNADEEGRYELVNLGSRRFAVAHESDLEPFE